MKKLSVVISAYNEEKNIKDCLTSAQWADEIILVDNTSSDKTVEIAKEFTDKIFTRPNYPMLNINKNFGFSKATGEWILSLDADERVTKELRGEILEKIRNSLFDRNPAFAGQFEIRNSINGLWIPRKNIIFGKWIKHTGWYPDYQLRLFRKGKGKFPAKHVHEMIEVEGKTKKLKNHLLHYNYQTISQFIYKLDKIYTENEAENLIKNGYKLRCEDALLFPTQEFIRRFFAQKGYKDGLHGLVLSMLMGFYHLVVFAKVWEKERFKKNKEKNFLEKIAPEFKNLAKELKYWLIQEKTKQEQNPIKKLLNKVFKMI